MKPVPVSDHIVFESDTARVPAVCRQVCQRLAEQYPLSPQEWYLLWLCLDEALTNAIVHGNWRNPSRRVVLRYWCTGKKLIVSVRDEGSGFRFDECCRWAGRKPDAGSPAGEWRAPARTPLGRPGAGAPTCPGGFPPEALLDRSGRGLALLRTILDEVYWNEARNELVMIGRLPLFANPAS